jgi:hypothetical protein
MLRAAWVVHAPELACDVGQVDAAYAVLDDDHGVQTPEQHGVHVDEIGGEDAAGLDGQELLPRRAGAAGCGADPGIVQDLPTAEAATGRPSLESSPCTRRCPQVAMRSTSVRIAAAVTSRSGPQRLV